MSTSETILKALSNVVNTKLNYVCLINMQDYDYFFCLGEHCIFILTETFEFKYTNIFYAHITKIVLDRDRRNLLQIQLSLNRQPNLPGKLTFFTNDRKVLFDTLKCSWQTDSMYRMSEYSNLPMSENELIRNVQAPQKKKEKVPQSSTKDPHNCRKVSMKGYSFFLNDTFRKLKGKEGTYMSKDKTKVFTIEVSDTLLVDLLPKFKGRQDLGHFCLRYGESLLTTQNYWVVNSNFYLKKYKKSLLICFRCNLTGDKASWHCWELYLRARRAVPFKKELGEKDPKDEEEKKEEGKHEEDPRDEVDKIRSKLMEETKDDDSFQDDPELEEPDENFEDLVVIMLRRKYIPPLMDLFSDIICTLRAPYRSLNFEENREKYKVQYITDKSNENVKLLRGIVDPLHPNSKSNEIYTQIVQEKANALLMDEEQCMFFQCSLNIFPDGLKFACTYLRNILSVLSKSGQGETKRMLQHLRKVYAKELRALKFSENAPPYEIIKRFEEENQLATGGLSNMMEMINWKCKIASYIANCIDGGLLYGEFTLPELVKQTMAHTDLLEAMKMKDVLNYLLYLRERDNEWEHEQIAQILQRMMGSGDYVFNPKVMRVLLETSYLQKELNNENPILYPRFLAYLLNTTEEIKLKVSICRQIIKINSDGSLKALDEQTQNSFSQVVKPLGEMITASCPILCNLATLALVSLANNLNIMKEAIAQMLDLILVNLTTKSEELLEYTLKLILSLLSSLNICKSIMMNYDVMPLMLNILKGIGIKHLYHDNMTYVLSLQIIGTIIHNDNSNKDFLLGIPDAKKTILSLLDSNMYFQPNEQLQSKIFLLLKQLISVEPDLKTEIGAALMPQKLRAILSYHLEHQNIKIEGLDTIFKLMIVLVKHCKDNQERLVKMGGVLNQYLKEGESLIQKKVTELLRIITQFFIK